MEGINNRWSTEIQRTKSGDRTVSDDQFYLASDYGNVIKNPKGPTPKIDQKLAEGSMDVQVPAMQDFLARQLEVIDRLKAEEEAQKSNDTKDTGNEPNGSELANEKTHVNEQIGPVQFNMGGIQVDAEDVLRRIKENARDETPEGKPTTAPGSVNAAGMSTPKIDHAESQQLSHFFSSLIRRGGGTTPNSGQGKEA